MMRPQTYLRGALLVGSVFAAGAFSAGCAGPDSSSGRPPLLTIAQGRLAVEWRGGPRRTSAEATMRREAKRLARRLFRGSPMPGAVGQEPSAASPAPRGEVDELGDDRPIWADGVPEPPPSLEHDLPRAWPVEVHRGETPALLAKWAGSDARTLLSDNADTLGRRRWLKTGDRLKVTMSANQKVAFDEAREGFQQHRLDSYFAKRYFERVVVYRVKRGEFIGNAAKRYGDVPQWLLEEFNKMDFRRLQAGDEVLIPVVATFEPGQRNPPPMRVVDEEGRPLTAEREQHLAARLHPQIVGRARMALDDSNVFERGDGVFSEASQALLPDYLGVRAAPSAPGHPVGPRPPALLARDIIVKSGESLEHYARWAGLSLEELAKSSPTLRADQIQVGARVSLPLTDMQYVRFMQARHDWVAAGGDPPAAEAPKGASAPTESGRFHKVKAGDTGLAIAKRYGVTLKALRAANGGMNMDVIHVGQRLRLP